MWLLALFALVEALPGLADHQLLGAYEELVTSLTQQAALPLERLPERLVLFSAYYVARRTLWDVLEGGPCACYVAEEGTQVPPLMRTRSGLGRRAS